MARPQAVASGHKLARMRCRDIIRGIQEKRFSASEVVEAFLERIAAYDHLLHSYITVAAAEARAAAAAADERVRAGEEQLPPLLGLPVAIKDLEYTRGIRTTFGSVAYDDFVPSEDAITVERLRRAGAIVLGKTNTPAFGMYGETKNRLGDDCCNPWALEYTSGASSGGSAAAVAAGLTAAAMGTDAAGSINGPAGMCGVYGFKPTHGRIPTYPNPGDSLLFLDSGPMTRYVDDAALLLSVLAGHDQRDPVSLREPPPDFAAALSASVAGLDVAVSLDLGHFKVDPEVRAGVERAARALEELGANVTFADPPISNPFDIYMPLYLSDVRTVRGDLFRTRPDDLYPATEQEFRMAEALTVEDYVRALNALWAFRAALDDFFENYDLLLTPTAAVTAFPRGRPPEFIDGVAVTPDWTTFLPFLIAWNMTGQPAASLPCAFSSADLPIGVLVVGRRNRDDLVLTASAALESAALIEPRLPRLFANDPADAGSPAGEVSQHVLEPRS
jgi:aspartyl-tRNA(Asn)/glutamyl-tRNA(Gln) amidotransferase subunit A